jgi:hypothetical protein
MKDDKYYKDKIRAWHDSIQGEMWKATSYLFRNTINALREMEEEIKTDEA